MRLDIKDWKPFITARLFPVLENGKANQQMLDEGTECFYVGAKKNDNGVMIHCMRDESLITKGNCIVFICNGQGSVGFANYMDVDFIGTTDIVAGYNEHLNEYVGTFLATIYSQERPKYSFGRKWKTHLRDTEVKLPIQCNADGAALKDDSRRYSDDGFVPDWQFMEDYIKSLRYKPLTTKNKVENKNELDLTNWKEFFFGDLISSIYKAKAINKDELNESSEKAGSIRYVTRTGENNGCEMLAVRSEVPENLIEEGNAISIGDTTATCFYQDEEFIAGDHMVVVRANSWLNKYTGLFVVAMLQREQYKYSYGRAFLMDRIKETIIKLPVDTDGNPDWQFMENYIKALPYGDRLAEKAEI